MTHSTLFQAIESLPFSVQYGVTNSLAVLLLAWRDDSQVQDLIQFLRENSEQQSLVVERLQRLAMAEFEAGTWHPHDMPVTAYLYILEQLDKPELLEKATKIVQASKSFFWARKLAQKIISEKLQNLPQKP